LNVYNLKFNLTEQLNEMKNFENGARNMASTNSSGNGINKQIESNHSSMNQAHGSNGSGLGPQASGQIPQGQIPSGGI
jgi:hypothetical protein